MMNKSQALPQSSIFEELRRISPKVTGGIMHMREEAYREKAVPVKYKLLAAMSISIALRCETCIDASVKMACDKGVSQEEFIEFLEIAMTMQGCPGEKWALKAYAAYKAYVTGQRPLDETGCCGH